jgi:hypothetical protein
MRTTGIAWSRIISLNRPGFTGEFFVQNLRDFFKGVHPCIELFFYFLWRFMADRAVQPFGTERLLARGRNEAVDVRFLNTRVGGIKLCLDRSEAILVAQFCDQINADILAIATVSLGPFRPGPHRIVLFGLHRIVLEEGYRARRSK